MKPDEQADLIRKHVKYELARFRRDLSEIMADASVDLGIVAGELAEKNTAESIDAAIVANRAARTFLSIGCKLRRQ